MTLTLKTAKHAIDKYGRVINIVEEEDILDDYSIVREDALNPSSSEYSSLKPCIVVTTAREALEAAWELAHVPEDGIIPAMRMHLRRNREDGRLFMSRAGTDMEATNSHSERRLIDPPTPKPEPWELSRYCYADGEIFRRTRGYDGVYWTRPGSEIRYYRDYFIKFSPKPIDLEGETE